MKKLPIAITLAAVLLCGAGVASAHGGEPPHDRPPMTREAPPPRPVHHREPPHHPAPPHHHDTGIHISINL